MKGNEDPTGRLRPEIVEVSHFLSLTYKKTLPKSYSSNTLTQANSTLHFIIFLPTTLFLYFQTSPLYFHPRPAPNYPNFV